MAVAATVKEFLEQRGVPYDVVHHTHTPSSLRTAEAAHIPGDRLAKAVLLQDDRGFLLGRSEPVARSSAFSDNGGRDRGTVPGL
jgi:hypothetical protein